MRKPNFGKPRSAARAFSLSGRLPRLKAPLSPVRVPVARPRPAVGRPGQPAPLPAPLPTSPPIPRGWEVVAGGCGRCGHAEEEHPVRYVCDKVPHPDPLQICGCEVEQVDDPCGRCGHRARSHKPRHRCKAGHCRCWGFEAAAGSTAGSV